MTVVFVVKGNRRLSEEMERGGICVVQVVCSFESVDKDGATALDLVLYTMEELDMRRVLQIPFWRKETSKFKTQIKSRPRGLT